MSSYGVHVLTLPLCFDLHAQTGLNIRNYLNFWGHVNFAILLTDAKNKCREHNNMMQKLSDSKERVYYLLVYCQTF